MRTIFRGFLILGAVGVAASAVVGCHASCSESDSCGTYVPPDGGASGVGGASGAGNHGGSSGDAGTTNGGSSGTAGGAGAMNGGAGEGGEAGGGGTPCDTTKNPTTEACLVGDDYSVFVAPTGKDNAAGTKGAPVATLSKAIELAAGGKFVVVCDATYDEHVAVTAGAQIYGGFKCTNWSSETGAPLFKPTTAGPALKIDTVADDVTINGVSFEVGDATGSGETALTAIVNASPNVTFESVSLKAGKGKAGSAGTLTAFTYPDASTLSGIAETVAGSGGASKTCMCQPSLSSTGGVGGAPVAGGQNGSDGLPTLIGGQAGDHTKSCSVGGGGGDGSDAPAASIGAGAASTGVATPSGWQPAIGMDGGTGTPGQGGGGGASRNNQGHGGGGGCGGCGGNGGTGGKGGGGSIALLLLSSPVVLSNTTLTTADAGNGGAGAGGQPGQTDIGAGGGVVSSINSCPGGNGGKGGPGGASGGGAGGISVGIVWKGATAPTVKGSTTTTGKAGANGLGGVPGTNDGIAGVKQDILQVP
jgi:hypothetical protein